MSEPITVGLKVRVQVRRHTGRARVEYDGKSEVTSFDSAEFYPIEDVTGEDDLMVYLVAGIDHLGRIWISLIDKDYDGYNADAILIPLKNGNYEIQMAEERNAFGFDVRLVPYHG